MTVLVAIVEINGVIVVEVGDVVMMNRLSGNEARH